MQIKLRKRDITSALLLLGLLLISLLFIIPIAYCVFTSFKTTTEILQEVTFFPRRLTLENYAYVFDRGAKYINYYWNTIVITLSSVAATVFMAALAGYAFAKLPFHGSNKILAGILFVLAFPLTAMLIPIYMMESNLGIINTHLGLTLPNIITILPFSIFIMRGAFRGLPQELEDSADIDGCGVARTWWSIMLPLAQNALVIVLVSGFYNVWGEYTIAKTLATRENVMPISVALTLLKGEDWNYGVLSSAITLSIIPPIVVFAAFQGQLVEGMVAGSIKG
ncbi:MAG: carbohydrate ABC transporter permease [Clostridiales bacterium]|nr:carbohydrate ABC transporter permease [Clostridiales bacterium]